MDKDYNDTLGKMTLEQLERRLDTEDTPYYLKGWAYRTEAKFAFKGTKKKLVSNVLIDLHKMDSKEHFLYSTYDGSNDFSTSADGYYSCAGFLT